MIRCSRGTIRYSAWACAVAAVTGSCSGLGDENKPGEEEQARAAAGEVAKNCHNPDAPNEPCATVEDLSRISPDQWRSRIRLFDGRDICVTVDLRRFERVGDNLRGVDRVAC